MLGVPMPPQRALSRAHEPVHSGLWLCALLLGLTGSCDSDSGLSHESIRATTWQRVPVTECAFEVEMPAGHVRRHVERPKVAPEFPSFFYSVERNDRQGHHTVVCTHFPGVQVPSLQVFEKYIAWRELSTEGLGRVHTHLELLPDSDPPAATYDMEYQNPQSGTWHSQGRLLHVDEQVHDINALHRNRPADQTQYLRFVRSYRRLPSASETADERAP